MTVLDGVIADLAAEGDQLRGVVAGLDEAGWRAATPAEGWDVATTIAHLLWTDQVAVLAAGSLDGDEGKHAWDAVVLQALEDPTGFVDQHALELGALPGAEILARWDAARPALLDALRTVPEDTKLPWFGPPMSPTSMATARFMETWAHSLDVYDGLVRLSLISEPPPVTDRIRHVAHIGVRTRGFSFVNNGLDVPVDHPRVELVAPSGATWTWGPEDAEQRVTGPALDFCRLVTQRIHRDDTALAAHGEEAERWLRIAQAFAGPAGGGRERR
jgi:uncharacterized protein (TIGR03084 family)